MSQGNSSSTASIGGAQAHLSMYGVANVFINTRAPKTTLWRREHVPITHFAYADVYQHLQSSAMFGARAHCELDRVADLIADVNFRYTLNPWTENAGVVGDFDPNDPDNNYFYTDDIGNAQFLEFVLSIGNNRFDVFDGTYMHIADELFRPAEKQTGIETGKIGSELGRIEAARSEQDLIIPIPCELFLDPGKAIESVAISKQRIRLQFTFRPLSDLIHTTGTASTAYDLGVANSADANAILPNGGSNDMTDAHVQVHFVWVTAGERSIILAIPSLTLYREVQKGIEITHTEAQSIIDYQFAFNNCVNDFLFVCRLNDNWDMEAADPTQRGYEWFNFAGPAVSLGGVPPVLSQRQPFERFTLVINNAERVGASPVYLSEKIQHTHYPRKPSKFIFSYPFARYPCANDPTGTLNFSMIDHQHFRWAFDTTVGLAWDGVILTYVRAWQIMTRTMGVAHKELQSQ